MVPSTLSSVADLHPAAERVHQRRQHPAAGVVSCPSGRSRSCRSLGDLLRVRPHLGPRRRRLVRVEAGLREQLAVVVQRLRVGGDRQPDDLALRVLPPRARLGLNFAQYGSVLTSRAHVGDLAVPTERPGVGERHLEHRRQRAAGELGRERGDVPLVLVGLRCRCSGWPSRTPRPACGTAWIAAFVLPGISDATLIVTSRSAAARAARRDRAGEHSCEHDRRGHARRLVALEWISSSALSLCTRSLGSRCESVLTWTRFGHGRGGATPRCPAGAHLLRARRWR